MNYTKEQIERFIEESIDYTNGVSDIDEVVVNCGAIVEDTTGLGPRIDEMNNTDEDIYNYELADSIMTDFDFKF